MRSPRERKLQANVAGGARSKTGAAEICWLGAGAGALPSPSLLSVSQPRASPLCDGTSCNGAAMLWAFSSHMPATAAWAKRGKPTTTARAHTASAKRRARRNSALWGHAVVKSPAATVRRALRQIGRADATPAWCMTASQRRKAAKAAA